MEVRVSCPDEAMALAIGRAAVEARLAACAGIAPLRSVFVWQGRTEVAREGSLSLTSRADLFEPAPALVRAIPLPAIMSHRCGADEPTGARIADVTA